MRKVEDVLLTVLIIVVVGIAFQHHKHAKVSVRVEGQRVHMTLLNDHSVKFKVPGCDKQTYEAELKAKDEEASYPLECFEGKEAEFKRELRLQNPTLDVPD